MLLDQVIDLDHPDAPKLVNSILKALEALTRAATSSEQAFGSEGGAQKKTTTVERILEQTLLAASSFGEPETRGEGSAQAQARDETMRDSVPQDTSVSEAAAPPTTGSGDNNRLEQMEHDFQLDRDAVEEVCCCSSVMCYFLYSLTKCISIYSTGWKWVPKFLL